MKISVHILIEGRVQGVCFRLCCREQAMEFGVHGWVRNLSDGSVEVTAEGEETDIRRFVDWCRRGPPSALVTNCREKFGPATGKFDSFDIRQ